MEEGMQAKEFRYGDAGLKAWVLFQTTTSIHHPAHSLEWPHTAIDEMFNELIDISIIGFK
ncbi:hypothetical protein [Bacillus swezeyi]|uniref:Tetracyclin repressor-like C-terminal domain-containing protein n=1 Tax=Bacillus swezeyi TaxID=1925020 RepID=A0A5M8RTM5_9BACI|nr:hypothetical protein [Bacillus swezeyi]KAA6451289.1 hypothetical protein DX927_10945 [Bacillus swezeyi]KAA6482029.1 hypothetical protein DX928_02630 [Bacillus swezeyi]TYS37776.1 hypothetical protein FZC77_10430 [Bacillus swezeyi]